MFNCVNPYWKSLYSISSTHYQKDACKFSASIGDSRNSDIVVGANLIQDNNKTRGKGTCKVRQQPLGVLFFAPNYQESIDEFIQGNFINLMNFYDFYRYFFNIQNLTLMH
jgi:hypothetical protein